ncbi:hypothetical protein Cgig2_000019 [Carnegiea gigantea]|uniref:Uncharacterized protein n=1 Tax=Carnegiea gigantea TaxID=171969 RepID=A0A9Q1QU69_9CARY|nr:hypothetical protein Cgig2_000019 [Carnegiea gigantea]
MRKTYFQCYTFDFFSMAIMNSGLLLKQYHPKSQSLWGPYGRHHLHGRQFILVQNLLNHRVKRKSETIVEGRVINSYTFSKRLIHGRIRLRDYEGVSSRQEERPWNQESDCPDRPAGWGPWNSGPSATIFEASPTDERPFPLSANLPRAGSPSQDEELVDTPPRTNILTSCQKRMRRFRPRTRITLCTLSQQLIWRLDARGRLGFRHSSCLKISHMVSYVISRGYETSISGLRMLGVEEYSQLNHEGVPGSKRGTV